MRKVHLIGNAHIDPVWLWRKSEGMSEILATFRSALDRMDEFPGFIFTSACAAYYDWVEKVDPAMFGEIQRRVKEGRWHITGGFWVQPDCNIPSGESFVRHLLYSQKYFHDKFGIRACVGYNVDSFGHNGMLPQIYKKAGIDYYVFMRPNASEKPELPADLFIWESPDGSRVAAFRITGGYNTPADFDGSENERGAIGEKVSEHLSKAEIDGYPNMCFYGIGNHGGGPTINDLDTLARICSDNAEISFSSAADYFDELRDNGMLNNLPVVKEDLQHHASGCYSANSAIKAANRRAEQALCAAEKYDVLASALLGAVGESMRERIQPAWKKLMFNQFHDILAGCSIRDAYKDALNECAAAQDTAYELTDLALHRISWRIKTTDALDGKHAQKNGWSLWEKEGEGAPVVVFNPHSFPASFPMQVNAVVSGITDSKGAPVALQSVRGPQTNGEDRYNTLFQADIPAFGYNTYFVYRNMEFGATTLNTLNITESCLENELIKVTFDPDSGCIIGYYDKETGAELSGGSMARPVVIDDTAPDTWSHGIFTFDKEIGEFRSVAARVLENGPVRGGIRVSSQYGGSVLVQDFYIYPGKKEIEVKCRLDFQEQLKILKLSFPVNAGEPVAVYSMPFGFIQKEADGREEPSHEWMGVVSKTSGSGLALMNDCKYSFSAKGNDMRMIVARGCIYADHYGERDDLVEYQDQGEQFFSYVLAPYTQKDPSDIIRRAMVLNSPPCLLMETHHGGHIGGHHSGNLSGHIGEHDNGNIASDISCCSDLDTSYFGISISSGNVVAQTIKYAENANGYIIRFIDISGAASANEAESDICFAPAGASFKVRMAPQEVKTYFISFDGKTISETYLTEQPL